MKTTLRKISFSSLLYLTCGVVISAILYGCGGGGGSAGTQPLATTTTSTAITAGLSLLMSSPELPSSGASGTEVQLTALVKDNANNIIVGAPVTFTSSSGAIIASVTKSDANGQVKATLSTGGDHSVRSIVVTAKSGAQVATGTVNVTGTSIAISGPASLIQGSSSDITITVKDSGGTAIPNVPVAINSSLGNTLTVKSSGGTTNSQPLTTAKGQIIVTLTGTKSGTDSISFTSQGVTSATSINVAATTLTIGAYSGVPLAQIAQTNTNVCTQLQVALTGGAGRSVTLNTSRGSIYSDPGCASTSVLTQPIVLDGSGSGIAYVSSPSTGTATLTASVAGGPSAQSQLNFLAPLAASSVINLQANPAVIGTNTAGSTNQQSTISAVVKDGADGNSNLVQGATVQFTIVQDPSGGFLQSPSVVTTDSSGAASVNFVAGPTATPTGQLSTNPAIPDTGVIVQAQIIGNGFVISKKVALTVAKQSLFITTGTGNIVNTPTATTYSKDYAVFVTDSAGNAVSGVAVTASVVPSTYRKGDYYFDTDRNQWLFGNHNLNQPPGYPAAGFECPNEDSDHTGIYSITKDTNHNGVLDPEIPLTVSSSGVTDSTGTATVTLTYPRDRANWTVVVLTIRGTVQGTEAIYNTVPFALQAAAKDFTDKNSPPPGSPSPYGINLCGTAN